MIIRITCFSHFSIDPIKCSDSLGLVQLFDFLLNMLKEVISITRLNLGLTPVVTRDDAAAVWLSAATFKAKNRMSSMKSVIVTNFLSALDIFHGNELLAAIFVPRISVAAVIYVIFCNIPKETDRDMLGKIKFEAPTPAWGHRATEYTCVLGIIKTTVIIQARHRFFVHLVGHIHKLGDFLSGPRDQFRNFDVHICGSVQMSVGV